MTVAAPYHWPGSFLPTSLTPESNLAAWLVRDHGIAADRVQSVGYGLTRPIADNRTAEGRATNRRMTAEISETVTRTQ